VVPGVADQSEDESSGDDEERFIESPAFVSAAGFIGVLTEDI